MDTGAGTFGPLTDSALRRFQSDSGVPSTGYYGPMTRQALDSALTAASGAGQVPQGDLEKGAQGEEVRQLQSNLVKLGYLSQAQMDTGPGIFGEQTEAALRSFQSASGVPSTGYYGPMTRDAMTQALSGAKPTPPPSSSIPGAEQAIAFASNPPPNPMNGGGDWHYWCLGLVNQAYQSAGQDKPELHASNAIGAYSNYLGERRARGDLARQRQLRGHAHPGPGHRHPRHPEPHLSRLGVPVARPLRSAEMRP
jgi:peptidoglycan hydrolase-like protein with peptidoglycan-binding domain